MTQKVGGNTNESLKKQITSKYGIKSLVRYDRDSGKVKPYVSYKFATVKELKNTLSLLQHYRLSK